MPCSDAIQRTALGRHAGARADSERLTDQQRNRERGRAVLLLINTALCQALTQAGGLPRGGRTAFLTGGLTAMQKTQWDEMSKSEKLDYLRDQMKGISDQLGTAVMNINSRLDEIEKLGKKKRKRIKAKSA
jgi:hypothetical protein